MKPLRIYTRSWCEDSQAAKEFLRSRGVTFEEIDIEVCPEAIPFVEGVNGGKRRTPTLEVAGHTFHASPFRAEILVAELGLAEAPDSPS
jgi:glutaredoxin